MKQSNPEGDGGREEGQQKGKEKRKGAKGKRRKGKKGELMLKSLRKKMRVKCRNTHNEASIDCYR